MEKVYQTPLQTNISWNFLLQKPPTHNDSAITLFSQAVEAAGMDVDIQKEYARQRDHLERSVASFRKKLAKDQQIHRADNVRIMQVCSILIIFLFMLESEGSFQAIDR